MNNSPIPIDFFVFMERIFSRFLHESLFFLLRVSRSGFLTKRNNTFEIILEDVYGISNRLIVSHLRSNGKITYVRTNSD